MKFSSTLNIGAQQVPQHPFQNQCHLVLFFPLFQHSDQDKQNGKHSFN